MKLRLTRTGKTLALLITALALAVVGAVALWPAAAGATPAAPVQPARCTSTAGLCDVVEYVLVRRDGTHQVWTCFLTRLPAAEGVGVRFPAYTCQTP